MKWVEMHTTSNASPDEPLTEEKLLEAWEKIRPSEGVRQVQQMREMIRRAEGRVSYKESAYTDGQVVLIDPSETSILWNEPPYLLVVHPPGQREAAEEMVELLRADPETP